MNESIYNNAGMPSEQGAAPEIPSPTVIYANLSNQSDIERFTGQKVEQGTVLQLGPYVVKCDYDLAIERIAALTLERDTLTAKVERLSAPVSDAENFHFEDDEVLGAVNGSDYIAWRVRNMLSGHTSGEKWSLYRAIVKLALAARASTPPAPLVFTCPFDGEIWRFHTQEQLDRLRKHLEWHATNINSKEYSA